MIRKIQEEQVEWVKHNFPCREAWQPLMGIVEEIGEYFASNEIVDEFDAIADAMIFVCDYCTAMGFDAQEIYDSAELTMNPQFLPSVVGLIAHSHLKMQQKIRVNEDHRVNIHCALVDLVSCLRGAVGDLDRVTWEVWCEVRKRDWRSCPVDGTKTAQTPNLT